jgi:hypothetical protein
MSPQPPRQPAFRRLDVHHIEHGGQRGIALADPLDLIDGHVFVPEGLLPIVGRFDGARSVEDIETELARSMGAALPAGFVADLVRQLDERLVLHSPRFERALRTAVDAFLAAGVRPARHAGSAGYPPERDACRAALSAIVPPGSARTRPAPRGLIAPHIDLERGRDGYARAYRDLAASEPADLYVIFGTGHQGPGAPVTGLAMDWATPLGTVRTDRAFVAAVHARLGEPQPLDVYLHRTEHSIEFQVLMLAHALGSDAFEVAGFLTGALPSASGDPDEEDYVHRLLAAFGDAAAASGKRICYVAGADLAHLGPHFGDAAAVDTALLERLRRDEVERLAHLQRGDPGSFHRAVEDSGNPDRICGTAPIYLTAKLAGGRAELLHYGQACAADGAQVVSFCSMRL